MDRAFADAFIRYFSESQLDLGLVITDVDVVDQNGPLLILRFEDSSSPGLTLGAWWDFHDYADLLDDPNEAEYVAITAKGWLEELAAAGGPVETWPVDNHGVTWGELDARGRMRLPPHLST